MGVGWAAEFSRFAQREFKILSKDYDKIYMEHFSGRLRHFPFCQKRVTEIIHFGYLKKA